MSNLKQRLCLIQFRLPSAQLNGILSICPLCRSADLSGEPKASASKTYLQVWTRRFESSVAHHWGKHLGHSCSCLGVPGPPAAGFLARLMRENREKTLVSTQNGGHRKRTELFIQIEAQSLGIWKSRGAAFGVPKYLGTMTSQTLPGE